MIKYILVVATFASSAPVHSNMMDGLTSPERVTRRYDVECGSRAGSVVIDEQRNRHGISQTVSFRTVIPLGSNVSEAPGSDVARIASLMARIKQVEWSCDGRRAVLRIEYLQRAALERAVRGDTPVLQDPQAFGRAFLVLDDVGLRPEGSPPL